MSRQLAITKKITLEDFEGWGSDCYLIYRPFNYQDNKDLSQREGVEKLSEDQGFDLIISDLLAHIVSGQVKILNDSGEEESVAFEPGDLRNMPIDFIMKLYGEMTGASFDDPKASQTTQPAK